MGAILKIGILVNGFPLRFFTVVNRSFLCLTIKGGKSLLMQEFFLKKTEARISSVPLLYLFQVFNKEFGYAGKQVLGSVSATNTMVTVGIDVHVELLVGLHQSFAVF